MADYCCVYTFGGVTINAAGETTDTLIIGEDGDITGLDGAPIRAEIDDQGQSDGGIVHSKFYAARVITFSGEILIQSVGFEDRTGFLTAINTLEAAVVTALQAQLNSETSLSWTPTGLAGRSISCTYGTSGGEIQFSGPMLPGERKFVFTLVADEPAIS